MDKLANVQAVFDAMTDDVDPDGIKGMDVILLFDISGEDGGQWVVIVADQKIEVSQGEHPNPTTTLRIAAHDFLNLVNGDLNAVSAFMQGLIKIDGDMSVAMQLQKLL